MRIGGKKKPFYRVVVVDERSKRTGAYLELLGTYNPLTEPKEINLKKDRIDYWTKQGAQPSTGYLRIIGKAPQRPPRKPKKETKPGTGNPPEERLAEGGSGQVKKPEDQTAEEPKAKEKPQSDEAKPKEQESTNNEKAVATDDSAQEPQVTEKETSEPVQNKNEGPA